MAAKMSLEAAMQRKGWATRTENVDPEAMGLPAQQEQSEAFLHRMNASLAEANRLQKQCRAAAEASAERTQLTLPRLDRFKHNIESAKAISDLAHFATSQNLKTQATGKQIPNLLGHLYIPPPTDLPELSLPPGSTVFPGDTVEDDRADQSETLDNENKFPKQISDGDQTQMRRPHEKTLSQSSQKSEAKDNSRTSLDSSPRRIGEQAATENDAGPQQTPAVAQKTKAGGEEQDKASAGSFTSDEDGEESAASQEDQWPPSAPKMRFKNIVKFSGKFEKGNEARVEIIKTNNTKTNSEFEAKKHVELTDPTIAWINKVFDMSLTTEYQLELGFAVVMLCLLDAIYPNKVPWRLVDWNLQYKRSWAKNYALLEKVWGEVNMEKARGFRVGDTRLRLENMPSAILGDKLEFLRLMKRWFDTRIHHAGPYDAMTRRRDIVKHCHARGFTVDVPKWMKYDPEEEKDTSPMRQASIAQNNFDKMPEFRRLIHFLGSPEHQTM